MAQSIDGAVVNARLGEETLSRELQGLQIGRRRSKSLSYANGPNNNNNETAPFNPTCNCNVPHRMPPLKKDVTFKRPNKKILKDPVLKLLGQQCSKLLRPGEMSPPHEPQQQRSEKQPAELQLCEQLTMATLVDGASREAPPQRSRSVDRSPPTGATTTCSTQARNTTVPPCDVTIDELASYFETFVHIPKKMSSMAEMMYI